MGWVRRAFDLVRYSARPLSGDPWKRAGLSDWILDVDTDRKYSDQTTIYVDQLLGDDSADGAIARPIRTLSEALRHVWARRQTGDSVPITLMLVGRDGTDGVDLPITYAWPSAYAEMRGLTLQGVGRLVSLAGQDVGSVVNDRTSRTAGQTLTLSVDPGWTPNVSLRDGYFAQNDASDGEWRAIAGATTSNTFRYSGGNYGDNLLPVAVATDDITIFKPGAQIDFDALIGGAFKRVEWSEVDFQRVDLVSPTSTKGLIVHNGPTLLTGSRCELRISAGEYGELEFERSFFQPLGNVSFTDFGRMTFRGAVARGSAGGYLSLGTGQCTFTNYCVFTDWAQGKIRITGHASVHAKSWGTLHLDNCGGIESNNSRVESYGPLRILGTLAAGTVYLLEINNGSYWAWDSVSSVMQSDDATPAEVSTDNGASATSADVATQTFIPGWADFAADYTASFTAVTGIV